MTDRSPRRIVIRYGDGGWLMECDGRPFRVFRTQAAAIERAIDLSAASGADELVLFTANGQIRTLGESASGRSGRRAS